MLFQCVSKIYWSTESTEIKILDLQIEGLQTVLGFLMLFP